MRPANIANFVIGFWDMFRTILRIAIRITAYLTSIIWCRRIILTGSVILFFVMGGRIIFKAVSIVLLDIII